MSTNIFKKILSFVLVVMMAATILPSSTIVALAAEPDESAEVIDISAEPEDETAIENDTEETVAEVDETTDEAVPEVQDEDEVGDLIDESKEELNSYGELVYSFKYFIKDTDEKETCIASGVAPSLQETFQYASGVDAIRAEVELIGDTTDNGVIDIPDIVKEVDLKSAEEPAVYTIDSVEYNIWEISDYTQNSETKQYAVKTDSGSDITAFDFYEATWSDTEEKYSISSTKKSYSDVTSGLTAPYYYHEKVNQYAYRLNSLDVPAGGLVKVETDALFNNWDAEENEITEASYHTISITTDASDPGTIEFDGNGEWGNYAPIVGDGTEGGSNINITVNASGNFYGLTGINTLSMGRMSNGKDSCINLCSGSLSVSKLGTFEGNPSINDSALNETAEFRDVTNFPSLGNYESAEFKDDAILYLNFGNLNDLNVDTEQVVSFYDDQNTEKYPTGKLRVYYNDKEYQIKADGTLEEIEEAPAENANVFEYSFYDTDNVMWTDYAGYTTHEVTTSLAGVMTAAETANARYVRVWLNGYSSAGYETIDIPDCVKGIDLIAFDEPAITNINGTEYYVFNYNHEGSDTEYAIKKSDYVEDSDANKYYLLTRVDDADDTIDIEGKTFAEIKEKDEYYDWQMEISSFPYQIKSLDVPKACKVTFSADSIRAGEEDSTALSITSTEIGAGTVEIAGRSQWGNYAPIVGDGHVNLTVNTRANFYGITGINRLELATDSNEAYINLKSGGKIEAKSCSGMTADAYIEVYKDETAFADKVNLGTFDTGAKEGILYILDKEKQVEISTEISVVTLTADESTLKTGQIQFVSGDGDDAKYYIVVKAGTLAEKIYDGYVFADSEQYDAWINYERDDIRPDYIFSGISMGDILTVIGDLKSDDSDTTTYSVAIEQVSSNVTVSDGLTIPSNVVNLWVNNGGYEDSTKTTDKWVDNPFTAGTITIENVNCNVVITNYISPISDYKRLTITFPDNYTGQVEINGDSSDATILSGNLKGTIKLNDGTKIATIRGFDNIIVEGYIEITNTFGSKAAINDFANLTFIGDAQIGFDLPAGETTKNIQTHADNGEIPVFTSIAPASTTENYEQITYAYYDTNGNEEWHTSDAYYLKASALKTSDGINYEEYYYASAVDAEVKYTEDVIYVKEDGKFYKLLYNFQLNCYTITSLEDTTIDEKDLERRQGKLNLAYIQKYADELAEGETEYKELDEEIWNNFYEDGAMNTKCFIFTENPNQDYLQGSGYTYLKNDGTYTYHKIAIFDLSDLSDEPEENDYVKFAKYHRYLDDNTVYAETYADLAKATSGMTDVDIDLISQMDDYGTFSLPSSVKDAYVTAEMESDAYGDITSVKLDGVSLGGTKTKLWFDCQNIVPAENHETFTISTPSGSDDYVAFEDCFKADNASNIGNTTTPALAYTITTTGGGADVGFAGTNIVKNIKNVTSVVLDGANAENKLYVLAGYDTINLTNLEIKSWVNKANIYIQGYNKDAVAKLGSIIASGKSGKCITLGYYTFTATLNPSVIKDASIIPEGSKFIDFSASSANKLVAIRKYITFDTPETYYSVSDDGTLNSTSLVSAGENGTLKETFAYGSTEPNNDTTKNTTVKVATKGSFDSTEQLVLSSTQTLAGKIDAETISSTVTFKIPKSTTAKTGYILYAKKDGSIVVLGVVNIEITRENAKIKSIGDIEDDYIYLPKYEDDEEIEYTKSDLMEYLPQTVDVVLESQKTESLPIDWTSTDTELKAISSTDSNSGKLMTFTGTIDLTVNDTTYAYASGVTVKTFTVKVYVYGEDRAQAESSYDGKVSESSFAPTVTLDSKDAGASIIYTTDGSIPDLTGNTAATTKITGTAGSTSFTLPTVTKSAVYNVIVLGDSSLAILDSEMATFCYYIADSIGALRVETIPNQAYTGSAIKPAVTVYDKNNNVLVQGKDYTIKGYENNTAVSTSDAKAAVIIKGKGNYSGEVKVYFTITGITADQVKVNSSLTSFAEGSSTVYALIASNNKANLTSAVKSLTYGKNTLKADKDYTVTYAKGGTSISATDAKSVEYTEGSSRYTITYTLKGNYSGTIIVPVELSGKKDFSKVKVTAGIPKSVTYSATEDENKIDTSKIEISGLSSSDYDATVAIDSDKLLATVTITAKTSTDYIGSKVVTYKLIKTKLSDKTAFDFSKLETSVVYTGKAVELTDDTVEYTYETAKGEEKKVTLKQDVDYTVTYSKNTSAGTATAIFAAMDGSVIDGNVKKTFKITKAELFTKSDDGTVSIPDGVEVYVVDDSTGTSVNAKTADKPFEAMMQKANVKPDVIITYNGTTLTEGVDYKVTYSNNKGVTDTSKTKVKYGNIKIEGKGGFTGSIDGTKNGIPALTFTVISKSIDSDEITFPAAENFVVYNAKTKEYKLSPVLYDGLTKLKLGTDFTVTYEDNTNSKVIVDSTTKLPVSATAATIIITGKGNYTGERTETFNIVAQSFGKLAISVANKTYVSGTDSTTISKSDVTIKSAAKGVTLTDIDYDIEEATYTNNAKVGTAKVALVSNDDNYPGYKMVSYKIVKGTVDKLTITVPDAEYSKAGAKPEVTVKDGETELTLNKDYTVSYSNNTKTGTGTATIKGKGSYSGSVKKNFTISSCNLATAVSSGDAQVVVTPVVYSKTKTSYSATVKITQDGKTLTANTDYTVSYPNGQKLASTFDATNIENNKIALSITPKGYYTGDAVSANLYVYPVAASKIKYTVDDQSYTGKEVTISEMSKIKVTYTVDGKTYTLSTSDYELDADSYKNNVKVGTASVTLKGKDGTALAGVTKKITFKIKAYDTTKSN